MQQHVEERRSGVYFLSQMLDVIISTMPQYIY